MYTVIFLQTVQDFERFSPNLALTLDLTLARRLGMKLISISRAIGSKKNPESLSLPKTAGIMSEE